MNIGSKGFYGLLALTELAKGYSNGTPVQVKEIARRQRIPQEYLGQILVLLKRSRFVQSTRGPGGGYLLARPPESISVREALLSLEGPIVGIDLNPRKGGFVFSTECQKIIEIWARGVKELERVLEETTLADLCKAEDQAYMYYI